MKQKHIGRIVLIVITACILLLVLREYFFYRDDISTNDEYQFLVSELGKGINIGNSLDACDWSYFGVLKNPGYQAAIIYHDDDSEWSESEYLYFDENGKTTISWDLSTLNTGNDISSGYFSVLLVDHANICENNNVTCKVTDVCLKGKDTSTIYFNDKQFASHDLTFIEDVCEFICVNVSSLKPKTPELCDCILSVSLEISNFIIDREKCNIDLEESWGNPMISESLIKAIKESGFQTIRIPVTYFNHLEDDGTIDPLFLDRVEQVVDCVLENEMYCIIDVHHDTGNQGWIRSSIKGYDQNSEFVYNIFVQIAERFKDKDDRLILEGLNEAVNDNSRWFRIPLWDRKSMNKWNQLFVDAVRSTGGNNANRYLLVNTYAALPLAECLRAFKMPDDTAKNRVLVGIHCYFQKQYMDSNFKIIRKYSQKYPLVIGEWGFLGKVKDRDSLVETFMQYVNEIGIPSIAWDDGGENGFGLYNRSTTDKYHPDIIATILGK